MNLLVTYRSAELITKIYPFQKNNNRVSTGSGTLLT